MRVEIIFSPEWNDNPTSYGNPSKHYPSLPIQGIPIFSGTLIAQRGVDLIKVTLPGYEVNSRTTIRIPSMLNVREVDAFCLRKILENFRNFSSKKKISLFQWCFLFFLVPRNKMKRFKWKKNSFQSWAIYGLSHFLNFHRSFIHSWLKGNFFPSDNFEISNINFVTGVVLYS